MAENNSDNITQKDLLKLLFDQAQHNATREEVQAVDDKLELVRAESNQRYEKLDVKIEASVEKLDAKIDSSVKELRSEIKQLDKRLWWIAGLIIALAFKTEILAFFGG